MRTTFLNTTASHVMSQNHFPRSGRLPASSSCVVFLPHFPASYIFLSHVPFKSVGSHVTFHLIFPSNQTLFIFQASQLLISKIIQMDFIKPTILDDEVKIILQASRRFPLPELRPIWHPDLHRPVKSTVPEDILREISTAVHNVERHMKGNSSPFSGSPRSKRSWEDFLTLPNAYRQDLPPMTVEELRKVKNGKADKKWAGKKVNYTFIWI